MESGITFLLSNRGPKPPVLYYVAINPSATAAARNSLTRATIAVAWAEVKPKQDELIDELIAAVVATAGTADD
jgi:hypothetical protein